MNKSFGKPHHDQSCDQTRDHARHNDSEPLHLGRYGPLTVPRRPPCVPTSRAFTSHRSLIPCCNPFDASSQRHCTGQNSMRHDTPETAQARCTRESHRAKRLGLVLPELSLRRFVNQGALSAARPSVAAIRSTPASESPGRTRTGWYSLSLVACAVSHRKSPSAAPSRPSQKTHRQRFNKCDTTPLQLTRFNYPRQLGDTCGLAEGFGG